MVSNCKHNWLPYSYKADPMNVSPSYWILQIVICAECMITKSVFPKWESQPTKQLNSKE